MGKILVVDDNDVSRGILAYQFCDSYEVLEAANGREALEKLQCDEEIEAVLLDLIMPEMDGIALLREMDKKKMLLRTPVFVVTADRNSETLSEAFNLGATDIITKPINADFIRKRIGNIIELYKHRNSLADQVFFQTQKIETFNIDLIQMLASLVETRNTNSMGYTRLICGHTRMILRRLVELFPEYEIDYMQILKIANAAILYDIGKIAIPEKILFKTEKLSTEDWNIIKQHPAKGFELLRRFPKILDAETYGYATELCLHHHERYDGAGYPDKLKGDEIPIWVQVVSLVDAFNALICAKTYRKEFSPQMAAQMINEGQCGAFNQKVLLAFNECLPVIIEQLQG